MAIVSALSLDTRGQLLASFFFFLRWGGLGTFLMLYFGTQERGRRAVDLRILPVRCLVMCKDFIFNFNNSNGLIL